MGDGPPAARGSGPLALRLRSTALFLPPLALALYSGGTFWTAVVAGCAALATFELYGLQLRLGRRPTFVLGAALAAGLVVAAAPWPIDMSRPVLAAGVASAFAAQMLRPASSRSSTDWAVTLAGPVYLGVLMGYGVLLRNLEGGLVWTLYLMTLCWGNDSVAYLFGRRFGQTPLAPVLSPRKTWEGAAAGAVASITLGGALPLLAGSGTVTQLGILAPLGHWGGAALGVAVAVLAPIGDLSKSFLKRQAGAKDAGQLIPGHGGVLDRVDSLLFAAVIVYYAARYSLGS